MPERTFLHPASDGVGVHGAAAVSGVDLADDRPVAQVTTRTTS